MAGLTNERLRSRDLAVSKYPQPIGELKIDDGALKIDDRCTAYWSRDGYKYA